MYKSIKIYIRTRCQVSVYRTTGPLVLDDLLTTVCDIALLQLALVTISPALPYYQYLTDDPNHHGNISVWSWPHQTCTYIVKTGFDKVRKKKKKIIMMRITVIFNSHQGAVTVVGMWMPMVLEKNKASSNITVFAEKFPWIQFFMIMELVFLLECYRDLILGRNFCLYMCSHILHNIWKWRVGTRGGGRIVCGPKTSYRADKNAVSV